MRGAEARFSWRTFKQMTHVSLGHGTFQIVAEVRLRKYIAGE
jgi:hypothetical protein